MKSISVLIVDDSSTMRKIVERSLRMAGMDLQEVAEAENGKEALARVEQKKFDVIFSDVNMPLMSGLDFVRELQKVQNAQGVPVIMITTEGSQTRVVEAVALGAKGYIRKPFTPDQIKERVFPLLGLEAEKA